MELQPLLDEVNAYFAQLSQLEQYGWIAMLAGFLLVVIGIILLFL